MGDDYPLVLNDNEYTVKYDSGYENVQIVPVKEGGPIDPAWIEQVHNYEVASDEAAAKKKEDQERQRLAKMKEDEEAEAQKKKLNSYNPDTHGIGSYFTPYTAVKGLYYTTKDLVSNVAEGKGVKVSLEQAGKDLKSTSVSVVESTPIAVLYQKNQAVVEGKDISGVRNEVIVEVDQKGIKEAVNTEIEKGRVDLAKEKEKVEEQIPSLPSKLDIGLFELGVVAIVLGVAYTAHKVL